MMDGRVKTLHPKVHGGILGRGIDDEVMAQHQIDPIDMVVNLYPFAQTVARSRLHLELAENIDIGGPTNGSFLAAKIIKMWQLW